MKAPCYSPRILSLITTYRCTTSCAHCCYRCSPSQSLSMSSEMVEKIVLQCDGFSKISFSGGEPFLAMDFLLQSVGIAYSSGNFATIAAVTNCFWAESPDRAQRILDKLCSSGLNLLGVSCDQYHQQSVPLQKVANAILAARKCHIPVQVNVISPHREFIASSLPVEMRELAELVGEDSLKAECTIDYAHIYTGERTGISVLQGEIMPVGNAAQSLTGDFGEYELTSSWNDACILQAGNGAYSYEGQVLTILPDYGCFPCCSLYSASGHLKIGTADEESLVTIIEKANNDKFIQFISHLGIPAVKAAIESCVDHYRGKTFAHICQFCHLIRNDPEITELFQ